MPAATQPKEPERGVSRKIRRSAAPNNGGGAGALPPETIHNQYVSRMRPAWWGNGGSSPARSPTLL
jgi:hypothetical protein